MISTKSDTPGIRRATLTQQVVEVLKRRILDGELVSGSRLWAADLADELGTSIIPVKEALIILQAEGLVTNVPRRGSIVRQFTDSDMEELYDLREFIEIHALDLAAKADAIDDDLIAALTECNERIGALRENGGFSDQAAAFEQDRRLHDLLVGASGHKTLADLYSRLNAQVQIIRYSSWNIGPRGDKTYNEHAKIVNALAKGDIKAAKAAVRGHLASIRTDFRKAIGIDNSSGTAIIGGDTELPSGRRKLKRKAT